MTISKLGIKPTATQDPPVSTNLANKTATPAVIQTTTKTTRGTSPLWSPTYGVQEKRSKRSVWPKVFKYTSKAQIVLRTLLGRPKDKDSKLNKSGLIYHFMWPHINCTEAYIGESGRAMGDRNKEHLKASLFNSPPQQFHRTSLQPTMLQHHTSGNTRSFQET